MLHALLLATIAATGCSNPRAPLMLNILVGHTRTFSLLSSRPGTEWTAWVRNERRTRLGLAIFLLDAGNNPALSLGDISGAHMPDSDRWLCTEEAWQATPGPPPTTVGEA